MCKFNIIDKKSSVLNCFFVAIQLNGIKAYKYRLIHVKDMINHEPFALALIIEETNL